MFDLVLGSRELTVFDLAHQVSRDVDDLAEGRRGRVAGFWCRKYYLVLEIECHIFCIISLNFFKFNNC